MEIRLDGKTAIVTGSTAGIGFAIAQGLAESGATVIVNGRTQARVQEAISEIKSAVPQCKLQGLAADLGTKQGANALTAAVPEADILVNNLRIFEPKPFFDIHDEDCERFFRVNLLSRVRLSRPFNTYYLKTRWEPLF